jgi:Sulfotransferase family
MSAPETLRGGARQVARRIRAANYRRRHVGRSRAVLPAVAGGADPERLVPSPVFLLSSVRSGSTLLRVLLNSHSEICAPHEMHLANLKVSLSTPNVEASMKALGFEAGDLEDLLWDRMLHLALGRSGKSVIVDKTPQNTFRWKRLDRAWPRARYIFLLRHPVRVAESMARAWPAAEVSSHYGKVARYAAALDTARTSLDGFELRYEDLVAEPAAATQRLCSWLGVPWEEGMLRYGEQDHGRFRGRLGDWSPTIRSGVIRPPQPAPDPATIPDELREACRRLGYL